MSSPIEFFPPMIDGVSASQVYLPPQTTAQTIYQFLCENFPHIKATEWQQRFQDGLIYAANGEKLTLNSPYIANTHIFITDSLLTKYMFPLSIRFYLKMMTCLLQINPIFNDQPNRAICTRNFISPIKKQTGNEFLTPIHRLDRETAGVVLFCKRPQSRGIYQQLFVDRQVNKIYHAIAAYKAELKFPQNLKLYLDKGTPFYTMQVIAHTKPIPKLKLS